MITGREWSGMVLAIWMGLGVGINLGGGHLDSGPFAFFLALVFGLALMGCSLGRGLGTTEG